MATHKRRKARADGRRDGEDEVCTTHVRLDVKQAHFVPGEDGADGVYSRSIVVSFVLSVLDEPATRERRGVQENTIFWSRAQLSPHK